jgi:hypothetical protein
MPSLDLEKALVLWANTSLGMLLRWWHSNRQQSGRGSIGKTALGNMPTMDVTALKPRSLERAAKLFDQIGRKPMLALNEIERDPVRRELDEQFGCEVLRFPRDLFAPGGSMELLRLKLAKEPSIRGSK